MRTHCGKRAGSACDRAAIGVAEVPAQRTFADLGLGGGAAGRLHVVEQPGVEVHAPTRVGSTDPAERRSEYDHLVPLHARRAALPEGHVDRERLRAELIAGYLPVARNIARRFYNRGENLDDVEQVASVGLVLAVDRFVPGLGFDFLSFAVPTITGEVLRHFRDRTNAIRVPRRLRTLQARIYQAGAELEQRNRRSARPSEIAERLGVDLEVVIEGLAAQGLGRPGSLDEPARDAEGWNDRLRFSSALGLDEGEFDLIEYRQALAPLLAALTERERRILVLRFFDELTQSEIGARVGISQMHVSRILAKILDRLRRQLTADAPVGSASAGCLQHIS